MAQFDLTNEQRDALSSADLSTVRAHIKYVDALIQQHQPDADPSLDLEALLRSPSHPHNLSTAMPTHEEMHAMIVSPAAKGGRRLAASASAASLEVPSPGMRLLERGSFDYRQACHTLARPASGGTLARPATRAPPEPLLSGSSLLSHKQYPSHQKLLVPPGQVGAAGRASAPALQLPTSLLRERMQLDAAGGGALSSPSPTPNARLQPHVQSPTLPTPYREFSGMTNPAPYSTALSPHMQMLPRPASAASFTTRPFLGAGGQAPPVSFTHQQRKPAGHKTYPKTPSGAALREAGQVHDDIDYVRSLPRLDTRKGSREARGTAVFERLMKNELGNHSWGAVVSVSHGDDEDDDTPRGASRDSWR